MYNNMKTSTLDATVTKLKELILSDKYHVGDKIPTEKELCDILKVGRSTVREALSMLKATGMVEIKHGRGTFIASIKKDDPEEISQWFTVQEETLNDFFEVRCATEILSCKYAVFRYADDELKELQLIHNRFENAILRADLTKTTILDEAFHVQIANMTHNDLLIAFNKKIADELRQYRTKSFALPNTAVNAVIPHQQIMQALEKRDIQACEEAIKHHIDISLQDIKHAVEQLKKSKNI